MIRVYPITPVPAPRQTRADRWKTGDKVRPEVARYRAYRTECQIRCVQVPTPFHHVVFVLAFPQSWSGKKKRDHEGMPHQCKPDRDNLEKALLDSVFGEDSHVWDGRATKLWGRQGLLILSAQPIPVVLPFDLSEYYLAAATNRVLAPRVPI